MCIFAYTVEEVKQTRIFVAPCTEGRQVTVYENYVGVTLVESRPGGLHEDVGDEVSQLKAKQTKERAASNAMILPCPLKPGSKVDLCDFSGKGGSLFKNLSEYFPRLVPALRMTKAALKSDMKEECEAELEVHAVGAYHVSIAPTLKDLKRVSAETFKMPPRVEELLSKLYGEGFGFIVCAFNAKSGVEPHPIGYIHDRLPDGKLFVPCKHEHGHGDHTKEHFDHVIFSWGTTDTAGLTAKETKVELHKKMAEKKGKWQLVKADPFESIEHAFRGVKTSIPFEKAKTDTLRCQTLSGMYPNVDLMFELTSEHDKDPYGFQAVLPTVEEAADNIDEWKALKEVLDALIVNAETLKRKKNDAAIAASSSSSSTKKVK